MLVLLRTIFFWSTVFLSLVFLFPFLFILQSNKKAIHWIEQQWGRLLLLVAGVKTEIQGVEKISPSVSYIIMANHQSYFDIFLLLFSPVLIRWMAKKELFKIPIFGKILRWIGAIEVDRENKSKAYLSIKKAVDKIREGSTVLIFPEGTRSADGELLPFNKGGFSLAVLSGAPILPITIKGSRKIMPKGSFRVFPGSAKISVHTPVETTGLTLKDRDQLQEKIKAIFQNDLIKDSSFLQKHS
ncbi:MAG TPA: lysophospholipid acyltransferase family protein [Thermodesulfobacteriota bacterium]|nr:lysophospholipid acyltransferase family protein [Thermodesulfobacteriota bacterium]